ncbi:ABC transporter ATP-binding protein [Nocardia nova]|uniref:ABC transporter ATP-binding protein n=1 Tax=Nocardia nova TaxID=37330 RepID=UPI00378C89CF
MKVLTRNRNTHGPSSTATVVIETRDAVVDFPIFDAKSRSLKKQLLVGGRISEASAVPIVHALREVTVSLTDGDRVGLIGHNGAGKSTLLRVFAGIYEPTAGFARTVGRVAPVFDLGHGMDPEISGYDNIVLRGLFLGMTRKQMRSRVAEIAEFTELGDYLSMPLRTYSTGMRVRLALGVVTSLEPEILLLDEGIGAVDSEFMTRARTRLHALIDRSAILVVASHTDSYLREYCSRGLWLDDGRIVADGPISEVLTAYHQRGARGP